MNEELLPFYERELSILRNQAAQFANQHPKIAGRLNLGKNESQDPHVERLLQGVAFLNARLHKRLDEVRHVVEGDTEHLVCRRCQSWRC